MAITGYIGSSIIPRSSTRRLSSTRAPIPKVDSYEQAVQSWMKEIQGMSPEQMTAMSKYHSGVEEYIGKKYAGRVKYRAGLKEEERVAERTGEIAGEIGAVPTGVYRGSVAYGMPKPEYTPYQKWQMKKLDEKAKLEIEQQNKINQNLRDLETKGVITITGITSAGKMTYKVIRSPKRTDITWEDNVKVTKEFDPDTNKWVETGREERKPTVSSWAERKDIRAGKTAIEYRSDITDALEAIRQGRNPLGVFQMISSEYPGKSAELKRILLEGFEEGY